MASQSSQKGGLTCGIVQASRNLFGLSSRATFPLPLFLRFQTVTERYQQSLRDCLDQKQPDSPANSQRAYSNPGASSLTPFLPDGKKRKTRWELNKIGDNKCQSKEYLTPVNTASSRGTTPFLPLEGMKSNAFLTQQIGRVDCATIILEIADAT